MPTRRLEIGDVVQISNYSRRKFLKSFALSAGGVVGLKQSISNVTGKKVEGEPIVHTYDRYGNPDRVRIIPEERSRRIDVWKRLANQLMKKETGKWNGIDRKHVMGLVSKSYQRTNAISVSTSELRKLKGENTARSGPI